MLAVDKISKSFGDVRAVRGVSASFERGRVHAVVGENGAGKSTLLKIAAGLVAPDEGRVRIDGELLSPHTAARAIERGVAMVQQHFALIGVFTALENIVLGAEPTRKAGLGGVLGALDFAAARARAKRVADDLGVDIPWDTRVESLGIGERQRIEIARALYRDARCLILDEPTAVLTASEADALYATLRRLADAGRAIVVVTHKLDEVRVHADDASVMRRGELVSSGAIGDDREAAVRDLADAIMGGDAPPPIERVAREHGDVLLRIERLTLERALRGVTLAVRAGEIVGVAGVEGNGQRELVRVLAGLESPSSGAVHAPLVATVHEDRHVEGLVLDAPVRDNVVLGDLARFTKHGIVDLGAVDAEAQAAVARVHVSPPDVSLAARAFSGGNQQKIVVIRAALRTERGARALVVAHPTRGVDLGAARAIHAELLAAARRGAAVLVVSADLAELRAICDRVLVMARGTIVADLPPSTSDRAFGEAMLGAARA